MKSWIDPSLMKDSLYKNRRIIHTVATCLALILVLIFAPRMDGPREIFGWTFTSKGGAPGLTDWGWAMLLGVPVMVNLFLWVVFRTMKRKRD